MATIPQWVIETKNGIPQHKMVGQSLPSTVKTEYSSEIDFIKPNMDEANQWVAFIGYVSALSGTDIDVNLYGACTSGGDKYILKTNIIPQITDTSVFIGIFDMNLYPSPYYYLSHTNQASESGNTITYRVILPIPKFK